MNLNGVEYYYIRNAQGDIIGLFDKSGAQVVSYTYDTWGKLIAIDGSLKDSVGVKNPYRYRGYRYDSETGLYYLQSRYYNPEWGRFINADTSMGKKGELLSHNLFSYCDNNPVNRIDPDGHFWNFIVEAVGSVAIAVGIPIEATVLAAVATIGAIFYGAYMVFDWYARTHVNYADSTEAASGSNSDSKPTISKPKEGLRRPYIRKKVRQTVEENAPRAEDGRPIDPNTGIPIDGKPDLGHVTGHEFWREKAKAESEGLTQKQFNDRMNNPDLYQLEDASSNRGHKFELK